MFSKEKPVVAFTEEKCKSCGFEKKRKYKDGDYLFKEISNCESCKGMMQIQKIYGELIEQ